jgi:hypothetical protein
MNFDIGAKTPEGVSALCHDRCAERLSQFVFGMLGELPRGLTRIDRGQFVELPETFNSEDEERIILAEQGL